MRRIVGLLLPAVIVTGNPVAGQSTARQWPTVTLDQAARTLDAGRHRLAASQFRALSEAEPGSARAWFGLGKSYEGLAREAYQKLQIAAPESAWQALIVADVLVSGERFAQALALYREVQQASPEIGGIYEAIADSTTARARPSGQSPNAPKPRHIRATAPRESPNAPTWPASTSMWSR